MAEAKTKEARRGIQITAPLHFDGDDDEPTLALMAFEQEGSLRVGFIYGGREVFWVNKALFETMCASGKTLIETLEDVTTAT